MRSSTKSSTVYCPSPVPLPPWPRTSYVIRWKSFLRTAVCGFHMLRLKGKPWMKTTGMPVRGPSTSYAISTPAELNFMKWTPFLVRLRAGFPGDDRQEDGKQDHRENDDK